MRLFYDWVKIIHQVLGNGVNEFICVLANTATKDDGFWLKERTGNCYTVGNVIAQLLPFTFICYFTSLVTKGTNYPSAPSKIFPLLQFTFIFQHHMAHLY